MAAVEEIAGLWLHLERVFFARRPRSPRQSRKTPITVFAAASLTDVLQDLGDGFTKDTSIPVRFSFAASSTLARQIENGAPADMFFSADLEWMDYLQARKLIQPATRHDALGNRLVLIAPVGQQGDAEDRAAFCAGCRPWARVVSPPAIRIRYRWAATREKR